MRGGALWVVPLALVLSCADMPNAPKALVHARGTILDKSGQPMFAVAVYFHTSDIEFDPRTGDPTNLPPGEEPDYRAVTYSDGTYDLSLPEGRYRIVVVPLESSGYAPAELRSVLLDESHQRFDYRYAWPTVTLRTVLPGGATLANSRAILYPGINYYDPSALYYSVQARGAGDALEAVVAPGDYRVYVLPGGSLSGYLRSQFNLTVTADTTITLTQGGYAVTARALGPGGTPMENAHVSAQGAGNEAISVTDASGIAMFHLPAGTYTWFVNSPISYIASRSFPAVSITSDRTLDLDMGGTEWTGTVRRAGDLAPLPNIVVQARQVDAYSSAYVYTGAAGDFRVIVRSGAGHRITVIDPSTYGTLLDVPYVVAGADSTFDLVVNIPSP